ncbi:MAG: DUF5916 domain-containing protein [Ignavibacteriaceae bacterium]
MIVALKYIIIILPLTFVLRAGNKPYTTSLKVTAVKSTETISIDGILSEKIWTNATIIDDFTQRDPVYGELPTERSEIRLAYDDKYLYVGAMFFDSCPDSIVARMSRRDVGVSSDGFTIFLDPYNDKRSGYYFAISAAGTLFDGVLYNDDWDDNSWDGVWEGKTSINENGWIAEMQIPFSQLKFRETDPMVWGINLKREIARKNETDYLVHWPKNESGFVSRFAELVGLEDIRPSGHIEILPYITSRAEYTHPDAGNPFNDGTDYIPGVGADLKMGIGSNLTLNATINPDFGQVEIDPAVINLSDVETFFSEKRPFFIEGSTLFEFGFGGATNYWNFNWPGPNFFYSRRIGRRPQGETPDNDFEDYPNGTHILGAAKITGKIGDSWNIGAIQALTSSEKAEYFADDKKSKIEVEPLSYYGIIRGQKEFSESRHGLGFISTTTVRSFSEDAIREDINKGAYTGGIDGWTFLDSSKTWVLTGWMGLSHVYGTKERMISLQENSQHYFQRPDSKVNRFDSSATSLTGYAGRILLNKQKGNFFSNTAIGIITPEYDVNDVGFLSRADVINFHIGAGYYWNDPTDLYRYVELGGAVFRNYDFDGNTTWQGVYHFAFVRLPNYYSFGWNLAYNPETINNRRTRGGPLTLNKPGYQVNFYANSDNRKDIIFNAGYFTYRNPNYSYNWELEAGVEFRPASNITLSVSPFFSKVNEFAQWVDSFDDPLAEATYGKRYIFAEMDQNTFGAGIRLNWTFNPNLSLQLYVQPLISSGEYQNYKELLRPRSYDFMRYGDNGSTIIEDKANDEITIDPDGDGAAQPLLIDDDPDFNYKSIRGNAVLRWEYLPGSVLYFVWTQTREDSEDIGQFQFNNSVRRIWNTRPDNIFMIKFTYWLNI